MISSAWTLLLAGLVVASVVMAARRRPRPAAARVTRRLRSGVDAP